MQAALKVEYRTTDASLQVGERRFRIFTGIEKVIRVENSHQHGALTRRCNVLLTEAVDSGTC